MKKNGVEIENELLELSRMSLIKAKSVFLRDSLSADIFMIEASKLK